MKSLTVLIAVAVTLNFLGRSLRAANVAILNGNVTLVIATATAGSQPDPDTDQTTQLQWDNWPGPVATKKITVRTNLAAPQFTLKVQALNVSPGGGSAVGEITVSTTETDFIGSIPEIASATCDLSYVASALASDGTGVDSHTITYTIVDQ